MKIYLDDVRDIPEGWTGARTFDEFKQLIDAGEPIEAISFDNDLGENQPEGYDVAKWLSDYKPEVLVGDAEFTVHSANPVARENISAFIESCQRNKEALLEARGRDAGPPRSEERE